MVAESLEVEEVEEVEEAVEVEEVEGPAVEEGEFALIHLESVDRPTLRRSLVPPNRP